MNAKLAKMVEDMKKQTIGVEIEMAEITRQQAAKVVAKYFGTERTVRHDGGSYDSWSCQDQQGRVWKITRDVSIRASSGIKKAELGTPILTYDDLEDLQEIARQLRHAGAVSNPAHGCGVHIHSALCHYVCHWVAVGRHQHTNENHPPAFCRACSPGQGAGHIYGHFLCADSAVACPCRRPIRNMACVCSAAGQWRDAHDGSCGFVGC